MTGAGKSNPAEPEAVPADATDAQLELEVPKRQMGIPLTEQTDTNVLHQILEENVYFVGVPGKPLQGRGKHWQ